MSSKKRPFLDPSLFEGQPKKGRSNSPIGDSSKLESFFDDKSARRKSLPLHEKPSKKKKMYIADELLMDTPSATPTQTPPTRVQNPFQRSTSPKVAHRTKSPAPSGVSGVNSNSPAAPNSSFGAPRSSPVPFGGSAPHRKSAPIVSEDLRKLPLSTPSPKHKARVEVNNPFQRSVSPKVPQHSKPSQAEAEQVTSRRTPKSSLSHVETRPWDSFQNNTHDELLPSASRAHHNEPPVSAPKVQVSQGSAKQRTEQRLGTSNGHRTPDSKVHLRPDEPYYEKISPGQLFTTTQVYRDQYEPRLTAPDQYCASDESGLGVFDASDTSPPEAQFNSHSFPNESHENDRKNGRDKSSTSHEPHSQDLTSYYSLPRPSQPLHFRDQNSGSALDQSSSSPRYQNSGSPHYQNSSSPHYQNSSSPYYQNPSSPHHRNSSPSHYQNSSSPSSVKEDVVYDSPFSATIRQPNIDAYVAPGHSARLDTRNGSSWRIPASWFLASAVLITICVLILFFVSDGELRRDAPTYQVALFGPSNNISTISLYDKIGSTISDSLASFSNALRLGLHQFVLEPAILFLFRQLENLMLIAGLFVVVLLLRYRWNRWRREKLQAQRVADQIFSVLSATKNHIAIQHLQTMHEKEGVNKRVWAEVVRLVENDSRVKRMQKRKGDMPFPRACWIWECDLNYVPKFEHPAKLNAPS